MKKTFIFSLFLLFLPIVASAQSVQTFIPNLIGFVDRILIPFLLGIAFLMFMINTVRYFIIGSTSEEGREKAKWTAIYSVGAFVLILIFWGIVNMFATSLGLNDCNQPVYDYYKQKVAGPWQPPCP